MNRSPATGRGDPPRRIGSRRLLCRSRPYPISALCARSAAPVSRRSAAGSHTRRAGGGSSNGRTADSDSASLGSNPSPPANLFNDLGETSRVAERLRVSPGYHGTELSPPPPRSPRIDLAVTAGRDAFCAVVEPPGSRPPECRSHWEGGANVRRISAEEADYRDPLYF